jgi:hypothetical protein
MRTAQVALVLALCVAALLLIGSARPYKALLGLDLASFGQRDVLVIRTSGDIAVPSAFSREEAAAKVTFFLQGAQASGIAAPTGGLALIKAVSLDTSAPDGVGITVTMATPELVRPDCFRLSQPSRHVILVEVFQNSQLKDDASLITDPERQLNLGAVPQDAGKAGVAAPQMEPAFDPDQLGVITLDLRQADASKVLGLAAKLGLLKANGRSVVQTEGKGELTIRPSGQSIASWVGKTPPGVLYLGGKPDDIAAFIREADPKTISALPDFEKYWGQNQSARPAKPVMSGDSSAMRTRLKDDPFGGLYYEDYLPGGNVLSDVRVTLPAMNGMNLYEVLDYLSEISGISLIIDPYAFDEPTGGIRPAKVPEMPAPGTGQPGFRSAAVFQPQFPSGGTVVGNIIDVPFDTALKLILQTQQLELVVYNNGTPSGSGRYGKAPGDTRQGQAAYDKPVILVTSRERVQQELAGTNTIDLYQMHYADPSLVTNLLANFNLLPGADTGWYIYNGNGGGQGGGGNNGSSGNSGAGASGGSGGSSGRGANRPGGNQSAVLVYRGTTRAPVDAAVKQAIAQGDSVIRILLKPEAAGQLVTLFAK